MPPPDFDADDPTVIQPRSQVADDPTVIQPRPRAPGGAAPPLPGAAPSPLRGGTGGSPSGPGDLKPYRNRSAYAGNPLIRAAETLFDVMIEIPAIADQEEVAGFQRRVAEEVVRFEQRARADGGADDHLSAARYALCSALDEAVLMTPWGEESVWSRQSLLATFHGETWGGEQVFTLLGRLREDPARNRDVCELICLTLDLGFEGRYRVVENGRAQLEELRRELHRELDRPHGTGLGALSIEWQGEQTRRGLGRRMPIWVMLALTGVAILGMFAWFEVRVYEIQTSIAERAHTIAPLPRDG